jgi:hypothetical protein
VTRAPTSRVLTVALFSFALVAIAAVGARSLEAPKDRPILTISGKIQNTNRDGTAQFDRAMLEALGLVTIETSTPWYSGPVKFEGVLLEKLMQAVGANGDRVAAVALNDYSTEIPISDFQRFSPILALKRNGEYMPVRDKGPLFIIYPYDRVPELRSQTYYGRSAWQVSQIVVK